jgi:subtilisin family serine protease
LIKEEDKLNKVGIIFSLFAILLFGTFSSPALAAVNEHANENSSRAPTIIPDRYVIVLEDGFSPQDVAKGHGVSPQHVYKKALNGFSGQLSQVTLEKLKQDSRVKYVEQDKIYTIAAQNLPPGMDRIDLETNAIANVDGVDDRVNVVIAVIDTGVDLDHPDLNVNENFGYDCSSGFFCFEGVGQANDDHNHGTHVAGIAAALDNGYGVVGVAPGATIVPIKVLRADGSGSLSGILAGIDYVTLNAFYIDVANMSLRGGYSASFNAAVAASIDAGVVYVIAAGNDADDASNWSPASEPTAITVSAITDFDGTGGGLDDQTVVFSSCTEDKDDSFACFSNYGNKVDIAAPGVSIYSTIIGGYGTFSGTSMAAPHVAGAAALVRSQDFSMTPAEVWSALEAMAIPQNSADGFIEDPDNYPEPLLNVGENLPPNPIPIADAGVDQNVNEQSPVTLDGTTSNDPEGETISFSWSQTLGPAVSLDNPSDSTPSFTTPTVFDTTELIFSLVVNDSLSNSVTDFVSVFVSNTINEIPIADAGPDQTVDELLLVMLDGSGSSDPNNDPITYSWTQTAGNPVSLTGANTVSPSFPASEVGSNGETLTFSLIVNDGGANSAAETIDINVIDVSSPTDTVHVGDLEYDASNKKNWKGDVWITVHNQDDSLVDGATVNGDWFESTTNLGSSSCLTDNTGTCQVSKTTRGSSMTFSVTGIIKDGFSYVGSNHDIDSDSDGTTISVQKGENSGGTGDGGGEDPGNGYPTEAECHAIVDQYNQKYASGKKIPKNLQSDYNECIELYEHLSS